MQICIFFCRISAYSQHKLNRQTINDSIRVALHTHPEITGGLDNKSTLVSGHGVPILGLEGGLSFNNKVSFMLGYYQIKNPILGSSTLFQGTVNEVTCATSLSMSYFSLIGEYTLMKKGRWTIYVPVQLGFGHATKYYSIQNQGTYFLTLIGTVLPFETAVTGNYRIWRFVGLSGGLGFRNALGPNIIKDEDFNGLTYSLGVKIWFGDLCNFLLPQCQACRYL